MNEVSAGFTRAAGDFVRNRKDSSNQTIENRLDGDAAERAGPSNPPTAIWRQPSFGAFNRSVWEVVR